MKLLLVSEGKHELRSEGEPGALRILVERLLGTACEIEIRKVSDPAIIREVGKGNGMFKRCVAWMRYAIKFGFDGLVLVIDENGDRDRLRQIDEAQISTVFQLPRAIGLAIRSFDAWILADEVAMSSVLSKTIGRQRDMEALRDPKEVCRGLCDDLYSLSDFYARVAREANLSDLEARCPIGFAPFANRVRSLA